MKGEPIIEITPPEVIQHETETFNNGISIIEEWNYIKSHVIYKGHDLGSFEELLKQKDMISKLNNKIEHLENDYYHALSLITGNAKLTKRKQKVYEEEYERYKAIRTVRILEKLTKESE